MTRFYVIVIFLIFNIHLSRTFVLRKSPSNPMIVLTGKWYLHIDEEIPTINEIRRKFIKKMFATLVFSQEAGASAMSPEIASKNYDSYAENYDGLDGGSAATMLGIEDARNKLLNLATGSTLEVGAGTGLNLRSYQFGSSSITKLTLLDVSQNMLGKAIERANSIIPQGIEVEYVIADATKDLVTSFGESKFDTVVDTFSLCVMGNQGAMECLKQLKGVVKSKDNGGRILLLENSRADNKLLGWYQDITADAAANAGGKGCLYNQDVRAFIDKSGLNLESEELYAGGLFRAYICTRETS